HSLAIDVLTDFVEFPGVGVARERLERQFVAARRVLHPRQHSLVCHDGCRWEETSLDVRTALAREVTRLRQHLVASHMIRRSIRVDDVSDRAGWRGRSN